MAATQPRVGSSAKRNAPLHRRASSDPQLIIETSVPQLKISGTSIPILPRPLMTPLTTYLIWRLHDFVDTHPQPCHGHIESLFDGCIQEVIASDGSVEDIFAFDDTSDDLVRF